MNTLKNMIDLRSDTVTLPTDKMRHAMANAEVGDDVYEDDPTMKKLEKLAAEKVGKEAALFVPSGTFGNQLALMTHTRRGDEVIAGEDSHIVMHEVGAAAVIAGVTIRQAKTMNGTMDLDQIKKMVRAEDIHYPETALICMENAHSSGAVVSVKNMSEIYAFAKSSSIPVHLDGARIFNAAKSLDVDVKVLTNQCDSVMFCLSKGLCAPVGSILAGSEAFIKRARKLRKLMGGGLRQCGILAAAGLVALEDMVERLDEDHDHAKLLAELLNDTGKIQIMKDRLQINMVFFKFMGVQVDENHFVQTLLDQNIKINGTEDEEYRFVTNHGVTRSDIHRVVEVIKEYLMTC